MRVRCPDCKSTIELAADTSISQFDCSHCGNHVQLVEDETLDFFESGESKSIGHFELVECIGMGGHGAVWKARDVKLDRSVAIKIPRKDRMTGKSGESFLREAQAAAQLQHPNIVSVHEVGRDESTVYIVTDFVAGQTLADWMEGRQLSVREAARLMLKVSEAVHHAHECGIVHRDLKPSNIMMDESDEPHIMDFGLAKREVTDLTMTADGALLGTPAYMSPEQARGEAHQADRRTDVYSLGVILFELLTGEKPFRGNHRVLLHQILNEPAPHPRKLSQSIPTDLDTLCLKCLEKAPAKRYTTAQELCDELRRFLKGVPIQARPLSAPARFWRLCARNPVISALSACLVVLLVTGLIVVTSLWLRAKEHAQVAEREARRASIATEREIEAHEKTARYLYVADMDLAQQAFEMAEPGRAIEVLERHRPAADGQPDLRAFEWYYWWRQCHRWERQVDARSDALHAVAFSSTSSQIATAGADGVVQVWSLADGKQQYTLQLGGSVFAVCFSPDGKMLATAGADQPITLWDADEGRSIEELEGHQRTVFSLAFSHDGSRLASGGSDTTVRLWDMEGKTELRTFHDSQDFVYSVSFSPDGRRLAAAGLDRLVRVWDLDDEAIDSPMVLRGHNLEVWSVAFSSDGKQLASGSGDKSIKLWDLYELDQSAEDASTLTLHGHTDRVRGVVFSQDASRLYSVGQDRTLRIWDLSQEDPTNDVPVRNLNRRPVHFFERMTMATRKLVGVFRGHDNALSGIAMDSAGQRLLTCSDDGTCKLWNVAALREKNVLREHQRTVNVVQFSDDGQNLLTASSDQTMRLWNARLGVPVGKKLECDASIWSATLVSKSHLVVAGCTDGSVVWWSDLDPTSKVVRDAHNGPVSAMACNENGTRVVTGGHDGAIKIWDATSKLEIRTIQSGQGKVYSVVFLAKGNMVATAGGDGSVRIWDLESGKLDTELSGHADRVWCLAVSADGRTLASGSDDRTIKLWDWQRGELRMTFTGHAAHVQSLAFSPDGSTLASGGGDKQVKLWDLATGEQKSTLKGHGHRVWSVAFSPDGTNLASSSYEVRLWRATTE